MAQLVNDRERAEILADRFQPIIYQEWKSIKDFPTSLMFDDEAQMEKNLFWAINDPTLYYRISEDDEYFYAFYLVFHPFDWSDSKIGFIRKLDSHTYDTEAICVRWSKVHGVMDIATVFHNSIKTKMNVDSTLVWIEAEGHGIRPFEEKLMVRAERFTVYSHDSCKLVNIDSMSPAQWERMKEILNSKGVDMPEQQAEKGHMFTDPDKLFARRD